MICRSIKGFTLVELLVVISILGVLAAALTTQVTNAREAARAMKCKTNLKNLAQAALAYAVDDLEDTAAIEYGHRCMPWARSSEVRHFSRALMAPVYKHRPGWVSWTWSAGGSPWPNRNPQASSMKVASFHGVSDVTYHSLSNGTLWKYTGADLETYVCESHRKACKNEGVHKLNAPIRRSYVMNDYFTSDRQVSELSIKGNAGALLLFAELPAYKLEGNRFVESVSTEQKASDGVVETQIGDKIASNEETIGFNHRVGKRHVAHVAFADGHVDGVAAPDKPSARLLQDLTCLMCNGVDVPADSGKWASARSDHLN